MDTNERMECRGQDYLFPQGVKMNPVGAIHESLVRVIRANMRAHRDAPLHVFRKYEK